MMCINVKLFFTLSLISRNSPGFMPIKLFLVTISVRLITAEMIKRWRSNPFRLDLNLVYLIISKWTKKTELILICLFIYFETH